MTTPRTIQLSKQDVLALCGIRLPAPALKLVRLTGIYCEPAISVVCQRTANRYVLRGRESGGAVADIGYYCGFVSCNGQPLPWFQRIETVGRNGIHAILMAPEFIRVQVFRYKSTYELLITKHILKSVTEKTRPTLENAILFHGSQGTRPASVPGSEDQTHARTLPAFYRRNGEPLFIPDRFREATLLCILGAGCAGCRCCHLAIPLQQQQQLQPGLRQESIPLVTGTQHNNLGR